MDDRHVTPNAIFPLSLTALLAVAFLSLPGPVQSADEIASPAGSLEIAGRFFNSPPKSECRDVGASSVCSYEITGYSVTSDGERYQHSILGISTGRAKAPNEKAWSRSYVIWEFDDGSTVVMKSQGVTTVDADGQLSVAGEQRCIDGTGRFANVDCSIDWSHSGRNDGREGGVYHGTVVPRASSELDD